MVKLMDSIFEKHGMENIRRWTTTDTEKWRLLEDGTYKKLAAKIVIPTATYDALSLWERRRAEAVAAGMNAEKAVISGLSAGRLWGLWVLQVDHTVDLIQPDSHACNRSQWPAGVTYRSVKLAADAIHERAGFRITSVSQTIRDITRWYGVTAGVAALDSARTRSPAIPPEQWASDLLGGRPFKGKNAVRRVLALSVADSESALESWARVLILTSGLNVTLEVQARINANGEIFRVDLLVNGWLVVEIDGAVKYDGQTFGKPTDEVVRRERDREKRIQNAGFLVLRIGVNDLRAIHGREPRLLSLLRSTLSGAGRRPAS